MVMLTVVGKKMAKTGTEFIFLGPNTDCKDCKVKNICFHLEKGTRYRVVGMRNVSHDCPVHEEGVAVVQVEAVPRMAIIPKKMAIEGSNIGFDIPKCSLRKCENWSLCYLVGVENNQKKKVLKIMDGVDCPAGQPRVRAMLE